MAERAERGLAPAAPKALGAALRELRNRRRLSLAAVAGRIGISLSALAMYERGERVPPLPRLQVLADFYGISLEHLLGRRAAIGKVAAVGEAPMAGQASIANKASSPGIEPRLENLPQFLRETGEVSEETIRQVTALIRMRQRRGD